MKGRIGLLLAVAAGIFTVVMIMMYLNAREAALFEQAAPQDVVLATRDILANTVVDENVIQVVKVPKRYVQPGAVSAAADAVGRVAAVPIFKGSQITGTTLQEGGREELAYDVPRGMRAITMAVDDVSGVAGLVRPGNFVDIVGTFEYGVPTGSVGTQITYGQEKTETLTIAQNVQVIAVGGEHRRAPRPPMKASEATAESGTAAPSNAGGGGIRNVTILVTPAQVQEMVLAQQIGALTLSLRSNLDAGQVVDLPRLDQLMLLKVPIPVKPRQQPAWREVRGSQPF